MDYVPFHGLDADLDVVGQRVFIKVVLQCSDLVFFDKFLDFQFGTFAQGAGICGILEGNLQLAANLVDGVGYPTI